MPLISCDRVIQSLQKILRILFLILIFSSHTQTGWSEWYVAGYGGLSTPGSLKDVTMDALGEQRGLQLFPGAGNVPPQGTLNQTLHTSDLKMKHSPLFGGKAGYFFSDEGMSWLGLEVESFTSQPTIKSQTVSTRHDLTYLPFNPQIPGICAPGITCEEQRRVNGSLQVPEASLRLITIAFNIVARYPGRVFQPYAGVGAGAFYFTGAGAFDGRQIVPGLNSMAGLKVLVTDELGFFIEGKFNRATISNFDPGFGLSGEYSAFNVVAGLAFHF